MFTIILALHDGSVKRSIDFGTAEEADRWRSTLVRDPAVAAAVVITQEDHANAMYNAC